MKSKYFPIIFFLIAIFFILFFVLGFSDSYFSNNKFLKENFANENKEEEKDEISLLFVGDIMLSRYIGELIEREGVDFPFELIIEEIKSSDIAFGNLENPISERGEDTGKLYSFRAHPETTAGLKNAGFDILSLANNHILDWGPEALADTTRLLNNEGIKTIGVGINPQEARKPAVFDISGFKLFYLAYSQFSPRHLSSVAVSYIDTDMIEEDIKQAQAQDADFIIVSFHWGEEYQTTKNKFQADVAKKVIDSGADIVIGHHPHVIQEVEFYKHGIIAYSLGNFIFDQNFSEETGKGLMLKIVVGKEGLMYVEGLELAFNRNFQPYVEKRYNIEQ